MEHFSEEMPWWVWGVIGFGLLAVMAWKVWRRGPARVPGVGRLSVTLASGDPGSPGRLGPVLTVVVRDLELPPDKVVYRLRLTLRDVTAVNTASEPSDGHPGRGWVREGAHPILAVREDDRGAEASAYEKWVVLEPGAQAQTWTLSSDDLVFPRRGRRTVEAAVELFLDRDADPAARGVAECPKVDVLDRGYLEGPPRRWAADRAAVRLAVGVARADGSAGPPDREKKVIEEWVARRLSGEPEEPASRLRAFLLEPLAELSQETGPDHSLRFREILGELKQIADLPYLYEVAELCFDVMRADERVHEAEWELITRIEEVAGLDPERCRALQEMRLSNLQRESFGRLRPDRGRSALPPGSLPV